MDIKTQIANPLDVKTQALVVNYFEDSGPVSGVLEDLDRMLGGRISTLVTSGEIKGKEAEICVIHTLSKAPAERVVIAGMGKKENFDPDIVRWAAAGACMELSKKGVTELTVYFPKTDFYSISEELLTQLVTEGAVLGNWSFKKYMTSGDDKSADIDYITIPVNGDSSAENIQAGIDRGVIFAGAANMARDMVNEPANFLTPEDMALRAENVASDNNLEIEVYSREQLENLGMRAVMAVGSGSVHPPKFMTLKYRGRDSDEIDLALVGKAVTFDSGGISIKPSDKMEAMKMDMAGGASVIAAIGAIARLRLKINVMSLVAAVENLPDGKAQRPGDVIRSMSGKTIEVISTDAEGRLTLADVVHYAVEKKAARIVDVATLTGACVIALGEIATGAFSNNQELVDMVIAAGKDCGEPMWQLPTFKQYKEQNKSDIADIKNVGGREGGAITAALFVGEFAGKTPWVHLDIAGTAMISKNRKYWAKGGTGVPARTLIHLAEKLSAAL